MQKLGFPNLKSLDRFKSLSGSGSGAAKTFPLSSRPSPDSISLGGFANLKLTAEKLVKEQASVKTDLEMALKKSMERIRVLEEKLQNAFNENAKLKHLASQVQNAEKDKEFFEGKGSESSKAIDSLNEHMDGLSLKLSSAEETIRNRGKDREELKFEKEENDRFYKDEQRKTANLIDEKDALIKKFEATIAANKQAVESLKSKMGEVQLELRSKEDEIKCLLTTQENLEKEKSNHLLSNNEFAKKLSISLQEIKYLEGFVVVLAVQLVELDKQNLTFTDKFDELNSLYDTCFKLVQQARYLAAKHAQKKYEQLHDKFLCITSKRDALKLVNQELNSKIIELQKAQESVMAELSEECHLAGERIQKLESEAESLVSKKIESEKLVSKLEEKIDMLSESSRLSENKNDLLLKISALEMENKDNAEKMQAERYREKQKKLIIWKRSAINEIWRKYEVEKQEIVKMEKEKADEVVGEMEQKCDQKECKEESTLHLLYIQEENAALKTTSLRNEQEVQIKALRCQFEDECRKLQEELSLQKSREDRQRALLQLQWRVMGDKPQEEQEVNSKKFGLFL
ncbi:hypothetical protein CRYUN_Cryun28dG0054000 [Craigia yunnanensis]